MVKMILLILIFGLVSCKHNPHINTVEVKVPVFQCPMTLRDLNRPERPVLLIEENAETIGELAKQYKITIRQLLNYAEELENNLNARETICERLDRMEQENEIN